MVGNRLEGNFQGYLVNAGFLSSNAHAPEACQVYDTDNLVTRR